uniref:AAA domain (Dynein-related subfamily) n=1 Tax=Candidatus Kentrum sp. SD TaxID=2126332 RepID=A0A450Y4B3_9GAMM|nr:MAG: AAA domain (dynein-related subfamily) [Candidatus Kentron sp. SD]VFK38618.1 MAG: AAA domain (dynein-related subfamily) [Candidatus Kentron sp. SD]
MNKTSYFTGRGKSSGKKIELPKVDPTENQKGEGYVASRDLTSAVNVALTLRMPLLLTGEPGSGKSRLANRIAYEFLGRDEDGKEKPPLEFVVKSDTRGTDLFYTFDTVGRFHVAQSEKDPDSPRIAPQRFITFNALGRAILYAKPKSFLTDKSPKGLGLSEKQEVVEKHPGQPDRPQVVLIDEIDKAPRDVPNDILTELENMRFRIQEFEAADGCEILVKLEKNEYDFRPIVIITSNSEKALPEAFMRRCAYFHVETPPFRVDISKDNPEDDEVTVEEIIASRLGARFAPDDKRPNLGQDAVAFFRHLRDESKVVLERKPSLAEFIEWLRLILPEEGGSTRKRLKDFYEDKEDRIFLLNSICATLLKEGKAQSDVAAILKGCEELGIEDNG